MFGYKAIEPYDNPLGQDIHVEGENGRSLMNESDLTFLCGALKMMSPKKIVEVGIAYGGTTAVIAECVSRFGLDSNIYSIDILDSFRGNPPGYLFEEYKRKHNMDKIKHKFYLGAPAPKFLDEIGGDIDFLIIDTSHGLPGELLEFITFLPYLKNGAMVILHDVVDHMTWRGNAGFEYATQLLLDVVVAEKYMNDDETRAEYYPNIAGFIVSEDTRKYVGNCFGAMNMTWLYMPPVEQYMLYVDSIKKNYGEAMGDRLLISMKLNEIHFERKRRRKREQFKRWLLNVYIYGAGMEGKRCREFLEACGIEVCGFLVSDDQTTEFGVYHLSEKKDVVGTVIIAVASLELKDVFKNNLHHVGINNYIYAEDLMAEL